MKYSLRTLMIVVALLCVLVGGRIEYLRRWAEFHSQENLLLGAKVKELSEPLPENPHTWVIKEGADSTKRNRMMSEMCYHQEMEERFRVAVFRPWMLVHDTRSEWLGP